MVNPPILCKYYVNPPIQCKPNANVKTKIDAPLRCVNSSIID